jgi:DNA phosphorothioation-associated putative methyltransferase
MSNARVGKTVVGSIYFHRDAIDAVEPEVASLVRQAQMAVGSAAADANVFKVEIKGKTVSLLHYPGFFEQAFPELAASWRVHLDDARTSYRTYLASTNPPILHRIELLLPPKHSRQEEFAALTRQAEQIGLFQHPSTIGFSGNWEAQIHAAGYRVEGHTFQPIGNELFNSDGLEAVSGPIERHRTALSRRGLSAPLQTLARNGLIADQFTYFDYGCGRGDDLEALRSQGFNAGGWDPHFLPDGKRTPADIVNLGFVINVIEDMDERIQALECAFALTRRILVVSVMLYTNAVPAGKPYRDGYLTQRNTFQKYFSQNELKEFVEVVLNRDAIPVAPGIVYVFADRQAEQRFLFGRHRNHHTLRILGYRRQRQAQVRTPRPSKIEHLRAAYRELIHRMWLEFLELGRPPEPDESKYTEEAVTAFGSWKKALRMVSHGHDPDELALSSQARRDDLQVYLALQLFARRKPYRQLDGTLQRDIKVFYGDYQKASAVADILLQRIANPAELNAACEAAAQRGLGHYLPSHSLQLHASLIEQLPALLRVYIGCAVILYGDLDGVDLVKIHIRSSKITLLKYDRFEDTQLPRLQQRVKITLKNQDIDFFTCGDAYPSTLLYFKSRYINEEYPNYAEQIAFDEALRQLQVIDADGYGPAENDFWELLRLARRQVEGFTLDRAATIPNLDDRCGGYFTYRDLIECGETWERLHVNNLPKRPQTYNALYDLCIHVLDPVSEYFGRVTLTYGFASPELAKRIACRICPPKDQHAGYERQSNGTMICERGGAAVDFLIKDESMEEVMNWIRQHIEFDRLYFYSDDRPLHISYSDKNQNLVYLVQSGKPPKRI